MIVLDRAWWYLKTLWLVQWLSSCQAQNQLAIVSKFFATLNLCCLLQVNQTYLYFFNKSHSLQFCRRILINAHVPAAEHFIGVRMKVFTTFLHIALFKYSRSTEKEQKRLIIITMQQILIPRLCPQEYVYILTVLKNSTLHWHWQTFNYQYF